MIANELNLGDIQRMGPVKLQAHDDFLSSAVADKSYVECGRVLRMRYCSFNGRV